MANLDRLRVRWSGVTGGPGISTFYFVNAGAQLGNIQAFFSEFAGYLPASVRLDFDSEGDTINPADGALVGSWSIAPVLPVVGTNAGVYAAPAGLSIAWNTGTIADRHRVVGRTFIVPIGSNKYQVDGTLEGGALAAAQATAATLVTASGGTMNVWHRPFAGAPATATKAARPAHAGSSAVVVGSSVRDKVAILRSRRD